MSRPRGEAICRGCGRPMQARSRHRGWFCAPCQSARDREYRAIRLAAGKKRLTPGAWDEEKRKAWKDRYYADPTKRARLAELHRKYAKDPAQRHKHEARWKLRRAVAAGRVVRQPCSVCGAAKTDAHHRDYSKPLDVEWLCRQCHAAEHKKARGE